MFPPIFVADTKIICGYRCYLWLTNQSKFRPSKIASQSMKNGVKTSAVLFNESKKFVVCSRERENRLDKK